MVGQQSQSVYRIVRHLATGGMAEVFQAESDGLAGFHKSVAIKRVLPHLATHQKFIRMFLDEARLAAQLNHRNIVQVFDVGCIDQAYFIVMQYIEGITVKDVLDHMIRRERAVPVQIAVHIAVELCNGLDYAHHLKDNDGAALHVVHRDVSPANVLISKSGGIRLTDFGLAKAASQIEQTDPGTVKGKYGYLAPETADGGEASPKADQFALGVVLWEMLAGRRLFNGESEWQTVQLVRETMIPRVSEINPALPKSIDDILAKALARDKDKRYPTMGALSRALTEFLFDHRLPIAADDIMTLVAGVLGDPDASGRTRAMSATPVSYPDGANRVAMQPIRVAGLRTPPERASQLPAAVPAQRETDGVNFAARSVARAHRRLWPGVLLALLALIAGAIAAQQLGFVQRQGMDTAVGFVRRRVVALRKAQLLPASFTVGRAQNGAAAPRGEPNAGPRVTSLAPIAIVARESAAADSHVEPVPDTPGGVAYARLEEAIHTRVIQCERRFGRHFRHARLLVTYNGATQRATTVTLTDPYFRDQPIGECIARAVYDEPAPPFRAETWNTGYIFMIH